MSNSLTFRPTDLAFILQPTTTKASQAHQPQYLIFDGATQHKLTEHYFSLDTTGDYFPLFLDTAYENQLALSPYVAQVNKSTRPFIEWLYHQSKQWCFFYTSPYTLQEQSTFWQSLLIALDENDEEVLFRFYDAHVLFHCLMGCCKHEVQQLLKACTSLTIQDDKHQWLHTTLDAFPLDNLQPHNTAPWWQIKNKHLGHLQDTKRKVLAKHIELQLWHDYPQTLSRHPFQKIPEIILLGLQKAEKWNLIKTNSIVCFIHCLFLYGDDFDSRPPTIQHLQKKGTTTDQQALSLYQHTHNVRVTPWGLCIASTTATNNRFLPAPLRRIEGQIHFASSMQATPPHLPIRKIKPHLLFLTTSHDPATP